MNFDDKEVRFYVNSIRRLTRKGKEHFTIFIYAYPSFLLLCRYEAPNPVLIFYKWEKNQLFYDHTRCWFDLSDIIAVSTDSPKHYNRIATKVLEKAGLA